MNSYTKTVQAIVHPETDSRFAALEQEIGSLQSEVKKLRSTVEKLLARVDVATKDKDHAKSDEKLHTDVPSQFVLKPRVHSSNVVLVLLLRIPQPKTRFYQATLLRKSRNISAMF